MSDYPRPAHPWAGTPDGHDCKDCPAGSIWRCDRIAHLRDAADLLSPDQKADLRAALAASARVRRRAYARAGQIPLAGASWSPRHRKPRWHDRPRAWLRGWLQWLSGQHEWDGTDDHGNPIGDLFHRTPPPGSRVWRTQQVAGVHLPLYGKPSPPGYNPAWSAAAFRHDVPRAAGSPLGGPGYRNLPRPGQDALGVTNPRITGPGQLTSVWDYRAATRPGFWAPRPDDTVIETAPRIAGYVRALAGAW